jgi:hypothetical protein
MPLLLEMVYQDLAAGYNAESRTILYTEEQQVLGGLHMLMIAISETECCP